MFVENSDNYAFENIPNGESDLPTISGSILSEAAEKMLVGVASWCPLNTPTSFCYNAVEFLQVINNFLLRDISVRFISMKI